MINELIDQAMEQLVLCSSAFRKQHFGANFRDARADFLSTKRITFSHRRSSRQHGSPRAAQRLAHIHHPSATYLQEILSSIDVVDAVDKDPHETIRDFCRTLGVNEPELEPSVLERDEVLVWFRQKGQRPKQSRERPSISGTFASMPRATSALAASSSAVREGRLHLVAQNLNPLIRMAE